MGSHLWLRLLAFTTSWQTEVSWTSFFYWSLKSKIFKHCLKKKPSFCSFIYQVLSFTKPPLKALRHGHWVPLSTQKRLTLSCSVLSCKHCLALFHFPGIICEEIKLPLIDWAVGGSWDILSFIEFQKTFSIEVRCSKVPLKNSSH